MSVPSWRVPLRSMIALIAHPDGMWMSPSLLSIETPSLEIGWWVGLLPQHRGWGASRFLPLYGGFVSSEFHCSRGAGL